MEYKYKRLSIENRIAIELGLSHGKSYGSICQSIGHSKSCVQREVSRGVEKNIVQLKQMTML